MAILKLKRGLEANRLAYTPQVGEPIFVTDTRKIFVGDGSTAGGLDIFNSLGNASTRTVGTGVGNLVEIIAGGKIPLSVVPNITVGMLPTGTGANNIPILNAQGKLDVSIIPNLAITDTYVVTSQAAMLALSAAEQGDVAVRTDTGASFILATAPFSTLANWVLLATPSAGSVVSVNGQTGVVSLTKSDVGLNNVDNLSRSQILTNSVLTGDATAVTQTATDSSTKLATTAYVKSQQAIFLANSNLTGAPTAVTTLTSDNSTRVATTAYVKAQGYLIQTDTIDGGTF
jgi:hypothetical protein